MLRRKRIVTACAALLFAVTGHAQDTSIRPFMVNVPEEAFVDLRRRLAATRWPSRETVADQSQGMQSCVAIHIDCWRSFRLRLPMAMHVLYAATFTTGC